MRTSKVVGAVFAVGLAGGAFFALQNGLDAKVSTVDPCQNSRLSYPDQNACHTEASAAADKDSRNDVYARYQAKADAMQNAPTNVGPAPTKLYIPGKTHVTTRQM